MKLITRRSALATLVFSSLLAGNTMVHAQEFERTWRTTPGDETWYLEHVGTVGGVQRYTFSYQGTIIAGGGKLELFPNGAVRATTTYISRDFFGLAIPVGSTATGMRTGQSSFFLDGFRLDGMVQRLTFR